MAVITVHDIKILKESIIAMHNFTGITQSQESGCFPVTIVFFPTFFTVDTQLDLKHNPIPPSPLALV